LSSNSAWLGSNVILNEFELELKLARVLNEPSLNTHFIAQLELELYYLNSTYKQASFEILKLDSARLEYIPTAPTIVDNALSTVFGIETLER
jgi:hypothetical protein